MPTPSQTYDFICFTDLAYEFTPAKKAETEKKIKRRLKYHKLGAYDQQRVDLIRQLKEEIYAEIASGASSEYFQKSDSPYAELNDFSIARMKEDLAQRYTSINKNELEAMIVFAINLYHMR